ncbi:MAG TPA: HlyD family efflux transporter periplasmic adaptor subunit [Bryobacteraceae bacterium]|jgi:multidrug resistance efflux pump
MAAAASKRRWIGRRSITLWSWLAAGTTLALAAAVLLRSDALRSPAALTGTFEQEIVRVTPLTGGLISEVRVHEGDAVEAGDVLLRLEDSGPRARYDRARGMIGRAASQLEAASFLSTLSPEAVSQLLDRHPEVQAAERAYVRAVADAERAGPADQDAHDKLDQAAAHRDEVRGKISRQWRAAFPPDNDLSTQLHQQLKQMEDQLDAARVTAPCSGTVEILRLQPGDPVLPGQPVAAIAQNGHFYVDVYATAQQRPQFEEGRPMRVRIANEVPVTGKIQHAARTPVDFGLTPADDSSRLFQIHITIDHPPAGARPGMSATVSAGPDGR